MPLYPAAWERIGASDTVIDWITNGIKLSFKREPEPSVVNNPLFSDAENKFVCAELEKLLSKGVLERVDVMPRCVSPLKVVPKKNGKFRLICDLRYLNEFCDVPRFSSEDVAVLPQIMGTNDRAITLDLCDGFYHFPIHPDSRTYLGFQYRGFWYVWCRLPFGWSGSPYFFHKCIRVIIEHLRSVHHMSVMAFVDDFLLTGSQCEIDDQVQLLLSTLSDLGLAINHEKSCLAPADTVTYLGFDVHCASREKPPYITVPRAKVSKLKQDISRALKRPRISARLLARFAGRCISMLAAVFPCKLKLRNVYRLLNSRRSWEDSLVWSEEAVADLEWWVHSLDGWNGRLLLPPAQFDCQLLTDASESGWGAVLSEPAYRTASGCWSPTLEHMFGPHSIDRFASFATALLPTYNSRFDDPETAGVDALGQSDWGQHLNFVNPPFRLIPRVLDVIEEQRAEATLIAPLWPGQPWMSRLRRLSVAPPLRLPPVTRTCVPVLPLQVIEPHRNTAWTLCAWRISGAQS